MDELSQWIEPMAMEPTLSASAEQTIVIRAVVFDLDGVVRHFSPEYVAAIEHRHELEPGVLEHVAFSQPLLTDVTTGRISRAAWIERIGRSVGNPAAAEEWGRQPWLLDENLLDLAEEIKGLGLATAILTNGTNTIKNELAGSRVETAVDAVFNSADIGHIKPDPRAFEHVLAALELDAPSVFFTDDSASKLSGAAALGLRTHLYRDATTLRSELHTNGIPVRVR